ncbi:centrobin [Rhinophrynus dorsalis]
MALPHSYTLQESSLLSGIEPLPLSSPTSPRQSLSHPSTPLSQLGSPSTSCLRRETTSEVTAQLYASLRRSRELENMEPETISTELDEGVQMSSLGPAMTSEVDELANEISQRLQEGVEISARKGLSYVSQMESLRGHLQNMLSLSKVATSRSDATEKREDEESDCTSNLLNARPAMDLRPPVSLTGLEGLFPRYASLYNMVPPLPDLKLRDDLERETARRKHLERHIHSLQNEMLELQQRLTVTLTADRRKDSMIQQLDQTLALVVGGWKQQEQQREETQRQLREEKVEAEQARAREQEMLVQMQQELAVALEALSREKETAANRQGEMQRLLDERTHLVTQLQAENVAQKEGRAAEREELESLRSKMEKQQREWEERERDLQEECKRLQEEKRREVENERDLVQQESQKSQQWQLALSSMQGEVLRLERDLQASHRERDTLQMELNLEKARSESERVRLESEHKMRLEEAITERLSTVHEESAQHLSAVREQNRKQLLDLTSQHESELSNQLTQFKSELQERDRRHRDVTMDYELRLSHSEERAQELSLALRRLESERAEMLTQLQEVMKSHWSQALRVLTSKSFPEAPVPCPSLVVPLQTTFQRSEPQMPVPRVEPGEEEVRNDGESIRLGGHSSQLSGSGGSHVMVGSQLKNSSSHMAGNCFLGDNTSQHSRDNSYQQVGSRHCSGSSNPSFVSFSQLLDNGSQNVSGTSQLKETSLQILGDGGHMMMGSSNGSQQMIGSSHSSQVKGNSGQNTTDGGKNSVRDITNQIVSGHIKETLCQSLTAGSLTNTQSTINDVGIQNSCRGYNEAINQSVMGRNTYTGDPFVAVERGNRTVTGSSQFKEASSQSMRDESCNSTQIAARDSVGQNVNSSSHLKGNDLLTIMDDHHLKEMFRQVIGDIHHREIGSLYDSQSVLHHVPSAKESPRGSRQESRSHSSYREQEELDHPVHRAMDSEESFYPLQMEELSHSFSSQMGFYSLEPHPDRTTTGRGSESLPHISPEHPFQKEPSSMFDSPEISSLETPPNWRPGGDQAPPNPLLQYYIRMLLDRTPGDPLNEDPDKESSHVNPGGTDISRLLTDHSSAELYQYLQSRATQPPQRSDEKATEVSKIQVKPTKNPEFKAPEAVKKEVTKDPQHLPNKYAGLHSSSTSSSNFLFSQLSSQVLPSQRRPLSTRVMKRVSARGGRPGVWR